MGGGQADAVSGLKPPNLKPQAKSDRDGVAPAGEF
jgi:hypothetical protein